MKCDCCDEVRNYTRCQYCGRETTCHIIKSQGLAKGSQACKSCKEMDSETFNRIYNPFYRGPHLSST